MSGTRSSRTKPSLTWVWPACILGNIDGPDLDIDQLGIFQRSLRRTTGVSPLRYATHTEAPMAPNNPIHPRPRPDSLHRGVVLRTSWQPREGGDRNEYLAIVM